MNLSSATARWRCLAFLGTGPYLLEAARAMDVSTSPEDGRNGVGASVVTTCTENREEVR
jgi:hypothetical protein